MSSRSFQTHLHNRNTHTRTHIKMITPELFVNLAKGMFGGYSAMMLLMPKKMVTDHFKAECDPVRSDRPHCTFRDRPHIPD